jgi:hypothetical protein
MVNAKQFSCRLPARLMAAEYLRRRNFLQLIVGQSNNPGGDKMP